MHLKRIQVPDFRVLKDVDISFEKNFSPRIFPLGSQNGGGKSTLLQLVFVLLHCAFEPTRHFAIRNMLRSFYLEYSLKKILAIVTIVVEEKEVELEFFCCRDSYIEQLLTEEGDLPNNISGSNLTFSIISELEVLRRNLLRLANESAELNNLIVELGESHGLENNSPRLRRISNQLDRLTKRRKTRERNLSETVDAIDLLTEAIAQKEKVENEHEQLTIKVENLSSYEDEIIGYLKSKNLIFVCNYSSFLSHENDQALVCQVRNISSEEAAIFLDVISDKVFLAAPSTQVFLFVDRETNRRLFREQDELLYDEGYQSGFNQVRWRIPGLFTYDFLNVNVLIDAFKSARDKDFRQAITTGDYGDAYKALLEDLNSLLTNKHINLSEDFSEITFKSSGNDGIVEFYPEDLSHGELKRLSIYMWLRHHKIEDAIVLMDEIEIALHPDWQYGIVSDLMQWAPNNQYILATHSYELCQALTPAHVKELEPKLLRQNEQSV